jgi:hypothetical protein
VVTFPPGDIPTCVCRKPQLTGIPCDHVLAVLSFRNLDSTQYVSKYYSIDNYINTWSGLFNSYGDKRSWPLYQGPIIRPNPKKINKGRRKHKRIPMVMDEMEGRIRDSQARQSGMYTLQLYLQVGANLSFAITIVWFEPRSQQYKTTCTWVNK